MAQDRSNIVLTGMAGCGKSSVGKVLARKLGRLFVDTDDLIVKARNCSLQKILDTEGPRSFRQIEEEILLDIDVQDHVIATGGSSIYSVPAMEHLSSNGLIVLLQVNTDVLKIRIGDTSERGLVKEPEQSFEDLYTERKPLYKRWADITVECSTLDQEEVCLAIIKELNEWVT